MTTADLNEPPNEIAQKEAAREATFNRRMRLLELKERREDRKVKQLEVDYAAGKGFRFSTAQATVIAAVLAVASALLGAVVQGIFAQGVEGGRNEAQLDIERLRAQATIDLEKQKQAAAERIERAEFETTLILKAIEAPSRSDQVRNLKFFLNAGFISDAAGKIAAMNEADLPSLSPVTKTYSPSELSSTFRGSVGTIEVEKTDENNGATQVDKGNLFIVSESGYAITASYIFDGNVTDVKVRVGDLSAPNIAAQLIASDDNFGLAIVKLPTQASKYSHAKLSPEIPEIGAKVMILGFEDQLGFSIQAAPVVSMDAPGGAWLIGTALRPGQGGAPVFSEQGDVIAVVVGVLADGTGTLIRPIVTAGAVLSNLPVSPPVAQ